MDQKITPKSTKNQILEAYETLLKKQQEQKIEEPKKVKEQEKKEELSTKAKSLSDAGIVKGIADLKVSVSSSLDKLGEQLHTEYKKFADLQEAIEIEKKNLQDLYGLSTNTDSFATMLLAQTEQKEKFDAEMASKKQELEEKMSSDREQFQADMNEKKALWKKEQEEYTIKQKEAAELLKKTRTREEEEYAYSLKITRKKEEDTYTENKLKLEKELTEKKAAFEKDFSERQALIESAEAELNDLREKNAAFPTELDKAVANAIKSTTEKLKLEHKFETELKAKEVEGELKLKDQTILSLNSKIKEMEASIKDMSTKTATAESSVKDIALKAIESSTKAFVVEKGSEGSKE